jgi:hypothetical protein
MCICVYYIVYVLWTLAYNGLLVLLLVIILLNDEGWDSRQNFRFLFSIDATNHMKTYFRSYIRSGQFSKWAGISRYTVPEFPFHPEFHTDTYPYILYSFIVFFFFWRYILVSLLRSVPAFLNFHFDHCLRSKSVPKIVVDSALCCSWNCSPICCVITTENCY